MTVMSRKKIHDDAKSRSHRSVGTEYFMVQSRAVQNVRWMVAVCGGGTWFGMVIN
jgi:hypothetical protein